MADRQQFFYVKPFDGNNYSNWEYRVKLLLEQQGVLDVISETAPENSEGSREKYNAFVKNDVKAKTIIVQSVADNILETIKEKKTAKEIMESLHATFTKKGISSQVMLQKKLRSLRFLEDKPLNDFLTEFNKTICELKSAGGTIQESEIILQLLTSMPDSYQTVSTAIDVMFCQDESKVNFEFVKNKLLMEESRRSKDKKEVDNNVAFMGHKPNRRGNATRKYGNSSGNNFNSTGTSNFPFRCHLCKLVGHKRADCPRNAPNSNHFKGSSRQGGGCVAEQQSSSTDEGSITFLTAASSTERQISNDEEAVTFVVDSGATNHLVGPTLKKLTEIFKGNQLQNQRR
uniref:CCHC-type domain-containing protein n=1 Tax=Photinus pyralis TaxID=7054 RepID=A0A1Y1JXA5_PHOPY